MSACPGSCPASGLKYAMSCGQALSAVTTLATSSAPNAIAATIRGRPARFSSQGVREPAMKIASSGTTIRKWRSPMFTGSPVDSANAASAANPLPSARASRGARPLRRSAGRQATSNRRNGSGDFNNRPTR